MTDVKTKKTKAKKAQPVPVILVRDMFYNRIQVGDYISYPARKQNDMFMRTAKVLKIKERTLNGEKPEIVLSVAMAKAARHYERAVGIWKTKIVKTTVSVPFRTTVLPKAYIENDRRYACLLDI